jgi:molybdopterin synthase sulfur carrier subunit
MIRVILPHHLQTLANCPREVQLDLSTPITQRTILNALELLYPTLSGTLRDHVTRKRRPLVRFFACEEDVSNDPPDKELPIAIADGKEAFYIIGAIAGG